MTGHGRAKHIPISCSAGRGGPDCIAFHTPVCICLVSLDDSVASSEAEFHLLRFFRKSATGTLKFRGTSSGFSGKVSQVGASRTRRTGRR